MLRLWSSVIDYAQILVNSLVIFLKDSTLGQALGYIHMI